MTAPTNPAGEYVPEPNLTAVRRAALIAEIERAPQAMAQAVADLSEAQLDVKYRNWTVRQIVHHLADSHAHIYVRFKWTLTEDEPVIKPYHEGNWADLADSQSGDVAAPLAMLDGVHRCWVKLLRAMTLDDFARRFNHPETGKAVALNDALAHYAWHGRHHTAQISWLRGQHGW